MGQVVKLEIEHNDAAYICEALRYASRGYTKQENERTGGRGFASGGIAGAVQKFNILEEYIKEEMIESSSLICPECETKRVKSGNGDHTMTCINGHTNQFSDWDIEGKYLK